MNCPSCGAPMHPALDCLKCDYCQSIYFPTKDDSGVRILGTETTLSCPVCSTPLTNATVATIDIAYCTTCRGMAIPMQAFSTLVDELHSQQHGAIIPPATDAGQLRRTIDCPHCHHPMDAHFYAGPGNVVIDSCETCLITWLDNGELARIAHAPTIA